MKNESKIWSASRSLFFWFWNQLGSILGGFGRPSWTQVGTKWHQNPSTQPIKKLITFWIALGTDFSGFWWILLSNWGSKTLPLCVLFGHILALEARIHPRALQEPPQEPPRAQFWSFFDRSWVDCWWVFDRFVGLSVCWFVALLFVWFVGCLLVSCLATLSQARGRHAHMGYWYIHIYIYIYIYTFIHHGCKTRRILWHPTPIYLIHGSLAHM